MAESNGMLDGPLKGLNDPEGASVPAGLPPVIDAHVHLFPDRLMYGTDFPNVPFAWDRELRQILALSLPPNALEDVLGGTARRLFGAPGRSPGP